MKAWDDDLIARVQRQVEQPGRPRSPRFSILTMASLRRRLADANAARGMRYIPAHPWRAGSLPIARTQAGGGGDGGRLPESEGCPYELRILHCPGRVENGAESRWYRDDKLALRAFVMARGLLSDPQIGLGMAILRDDCLVYQWTELAGSDEHDLDVATHRHQGCPGHADADVFDRLARVYDHYGALGYRENGRCSHGCVATCPGRHGDLLAAMLRAEASEIEEIAVDHDQPVSPRGPGGRDAPTDRPFLRPTGGAISRRRSDVGRRGPRS